MAHRPLISWLVAMAVHGLAAGLASGLALFLLQPDLRLLLGEQPDPAVAFGVFLLMCSQIGVLVSISLSLMVDWSS